MPLITFLLNANYNNIETQNTFPYYICVHLNPYTFQIDWGYDRYTDELIWLYLLFTFRAYHQIDNSGNMTGDTGEAGTTYPSGVHPTNFSTVPIAKFEFSV